MGLIDECLVTVRRGALDVWSPRNLSSTKFPVKDGSSTFPHVTFPLGQEKNEGSPVRTSRPRMDGVNRRGGFRSPVSVTIGRSGRPCVHGGKTVPTLSVPG